MNMMSWTGDIRCLYCDGKLPLLRKITNGQFCCAAHRKLYWQEQERLGVERLHQTHTSLQAIRPPEGVEAILGVPEQHEESISAAELETIAPPIAGMVGFFAMPQPRWPADQPNAEAPDPFEPVGRVRLPLRPAGFALPEPIGGMVAGVARVAFEPNDYKSARRIEPVHSVVYPWKEISSAAIPAGSAFAIEGEADNIPRAENLLALAPFAALESTDARPRLEPWAAAAFSILERPLLPLEIALTGSRKLTARPKSAGLLPLAIDKVPLVHGTWIDSLRAMGKETGGEMPQYELSTPPLRPRLKLAAGSRYPMTTRDAAVTMVAKEPESLPAGNMVAIPQRYGIPAIGGGSGKGLTEPNAAGLVPMEPVKANEPNSPRPVAMVNLPQPLRTEPMRPASHLEPVDAPATPTWMPPPVEEKPTHLASELLLPSSDAPRAGVVIGHVKNFWMQAPRDLKLLLFAIPILLGLALQPSLRKIPYTAPKPAAAVAAEHNFQSKLHEQFQNVRQTMVERAAVALDEDFRSGLDDWTSRGGTTEWAFDATGFVRPGPLALYRPSLELSDYQVQFLGMIDKKALSWVVRAADFDDYYVVKLVILKPGPVPTVGVTRYAVIHGVAQDRGDTTAFINAREDMLYRVNMDIHGDVFALTVQGQMVDSWTEPRLRKGGVGFFTARGEASRLRWVQVTHQYDMLGRLCAYLAPYNIPSTNGGWQP
jgi:hypothetical protein